LSQHADADLNLILEYISIPGFIRFFKSTYFCVSRLTHYIWRSARIRVWINKPSNHARCQQSCTIPATTHDASNHARYQQPHTMPATMHDVGNHTLCQQSHAMQQPHAMPAIACYASNHAWCYQITHYGSNRTLCQQPRTMSILYAPRFCSASMGLFL